MEKRFIPKNVDFDKNEFFSTLSDLLPNLKDFHLGLGSGSPIFIFLFLKLLDANDFSFSIKLFSIFQKKITSHMESFSLYFWRFF